MRVDNVETVTSVYKAVILGQPVISRNVTVTGDGIRTPKNFSVLTGTDLSELVDAAGGLKGKNRESNLRWTDDGICAV